MNVLVVDNYDSFTYNLVHYVESFLSQSDTLKVLRNDEVNVNDIAKYDKIILSPGPGLPKEAHNLLAIVEKSVKLQKQLLGVCLGHQAIAQYFGASLLNLQHPFHGVDSVMRVIADSILYLHLPKKIKVGRYHSWVVDNKQFPQQLVIDGIDEQNRIMSFHHKYLPVFGVQYHPESILTNEGKEIIRNFLQI